MLYVELLQYAAIGIVHLIHMFVKIVYCINCKGVVKEDSEKHHPCIRTAQGVSLCIPIVIQIRLMADNNSQCTS